MNKLLFDIQTVQSSAFRTLVEALKDILTDCNFIIDETGIKLLATDNSHSVLIHMKLQAENFDIYECKEKITIGINMNNLYKLIKTMSNNDTLGLFMCEDDTNVLSIRLDNKELKQDLRQPLEFLIQQLDLRTHSLLSLSL